MFPVLVLSIALMITPGALAEAPDRAVEACLADLDTCLAKKRHAIAKTAAMGASIRPHLDGEGKVVGIDITAVEAGTGAESAGLEPGDRLLAWNETVIDATTVEGFYGVHRSLKVGQVIRYRVEREGQSINLTMTAQSRSEESIDGSLAHWVYETLGCGVYGALWPEETTP